MAENLGWPEDQFVNIHFDACLFFKDDSKNIYGDILLAEYILSIHGSTTGTSLSKRRRTSQNLLGGQCTEKRGSSFVERLVRFQKENDHFVTALHSSDMQELITNFPSVKKCVLSAQVYHGILEKNYKLKDIPWLVDLIKAKCLLEDRLVTDLTDLQDIDEIFTFMQEILPKVSGSSCPSSVKGAKAPKGKSGQLKAFVAMLDKGQIMAEATLKELAESLALDIVLTNWNQILDSLNQQGILLKASGDQYKVL